MRRNNKLSFCIKASLIFLAVSFLFYSCKKGEMSNSIVATDDNSIFTTGVASLKVNVLGETFETEEGPAPETSKTSSVNAGAMNVKEEVQNQVIPFNKDFNLVAELIPVSSNINNRVQSSVKEAGVGAVETNDFGNGIRYKVVVYDQNTGIYVTERNYVRGAEDKTAALNLDGGTKYSFIAYSVGSTTDLPDVIFGDPIKSRAQSSFKVTLPNRAMYYNVNLQLSGGKTNYLNIVFKNKFSQITTNIDASAVGGAITKLDNTTIKPSGSSVSFNMENGGIITYGDTSPGVSVVFPNLNTQVVTSTPTQIIANTTSDGVFNIGSITVNGTKVDNLSFKNVKITPGVKYNLNIKFAKQSENSYNSLCTQSEYGYNISRDKNNPTSITLGDGQKVNVYAMVSGSAQDPYNWFSATASTGGVTMSRNYYRIGGSYDAITPSGSYTRVTLIFDRPINYVGSKATWFWYTDSQVISTSDGGILNAKNIIGGAGLNFQGTGTSLTATAAYGTTYGGIAYIIEAQNYFTQLTVSTATNYNDILQAFTFCNARVR